MVGRLLGRGMWLLGDGHLECGRFLFGVALVCFGSVVWVAPQSAWPGFTAGLAVPRRLDKVDGLE